MLGFTPIASKPVASLDDKAYVGGTASRLFQRNTTLNGQTRGGTALFDLLTTQGSAVDTAVVNTTVAGTEIQFTKTAGGSPVAWITPRFSAAITVTGMDIANWFSESTDLVNAGARYRIYRWRAGVETEFTGSPSDDGVEFTTVQALYTWATSITPLAFLEDDRLLIVPYVTNVGVMTMGTATLYFNGNTNSTASPVLTYHARADLIASGATQTATGIAIGTAYANRLVIATISTATPPTRYLVGATIGGIVATIKQSCTDDTFQSGSFIISAPVPTGTTANIVLTYDNTIPNNGAIATYSVDNTLVGVSNGGSNKTSSAATLGAPYTSTSGGITVAGIYFSNGSGSKLPIVVTGYTKDYTDAGFTSFSKTESASGAQTSTATWTGNFDAVTTVEHWPPSTITTYGDSYFNVYPAITFKAEGGGGVTISATVAELSLTGLQAAVSNARVISAGIGSLSLVGLSATIATNVTVNATLGQLNLTGLGASISNATNVGASTGQLSLIGLAAGISNSTNVSANIGELSLTGLTAGITNVGGTVISANTGEILLNGLSATIANSTTISANVGQLNLIGLQAAISNTTAISANVGNLSLTGLSASVNNAYSVSASTGQLSLTGFAAAVANSPAGNITINAELGELSLIGLQATIANGANQGGGHALYIPRKKSKRVVAEQEYDVEHDELSEQEAEIKALMLVAQQKSVKTAKSRKAAKLFELPQLETPKTELELPIAIINNIIGQEVVIDDDEVEMMLVLMMEMM